MNFGTLSDWAEWAGGRTAVREVVPGLGDAAFTGPKAGPEPSLLAFRAGPRAVRIASTQVNEDGTRTVTMEQLTEIAKLIESRLQ